MTKDEIIQYIANVALISAIDGKLSPLETEAVESVRNQLGASASDLQQALTTAVQGNYQPCPIGRFSDKIRNLEDMIFVSMVDGDFAKSEKSEVVSFAKSIKVTQDQLTEMLSETRRRVLSQKSKSNCTSCGKDIPSNSKFCPKCGSKI